MSKIILFLIVFLVAFPLRKAFFRNWRVTIPASIGAFSGHFMAIMAGQYGNLPSWVDLMWTVMGAGLLAFKGKQILDKMFPPDQERKR